MVAADRPRMSLGARLTNVFTGPGEVFDEVKSSPPSTENWLVPAILSCVVGIVSVVVVFSQEAILRQIHEQKELAMEKSLAKMPKEQREKALKMAEMMSGPTVMKALGSIKSILVGFSWPFFMGLVLWGSGAWLFKGTFTYMQAVEVCGLAAMISVLGVIIWTLLAVVMGNPMVTPGPVLLISEPNGSNLLHLALSVLNVMTLWYIAVLAVGLAKLSGTSFAKAALWLFSLWAVVTTSSILIGWAMQRAFS